MLLGSPPNQGRWKDDPDWQIWFTNLYAICTNALSSAPITAPITAPLTNDESSAAIVIGAPVYADAANGVKRAKANTIGTARVIGLGGDISIAAGAVGNIATSGVLTATTGQWDAVCGTSGGLAFGTVYYLSAATVGLLTATAPSAAGQFVAAVGIALSTTKMKIDIAPPIGL
jgi:hypothetical protein